MFKQQKKGQAAMEFLMTYGWAILVVLAAIGALAYFGVLSPEKLVPERTTFTAPFPSSEAAVVSLSGKTVEVALTNNYGQTVTLLNTGENGTEDCTNPTLKVFNTTSSAYEDTSIDLRNGDTFLIQYTCAVFTGNVGDRFETELTFAYTTPSGLTHTHSGTVSGQVKQ